MPMLVPEDSINDVLEIANPAINLRAIVDKRGGLVSFRSFVSGIYLTICGYLPQWMLWYQRINGL